MSSSVTFRSEHVIASAYSSVTGSRSLNRLLARQSSSAQSLSSLMPRFSTVAELM